MSRREGPAPAVTVIAGGYGAARLLAGLVRVRPASAVTAIVNCGDDIVLGGLHISPDLDTITYCLAGELNPETGWGLRDESWRALETLRHLGGEGWFGLGDRDLGTHLYRTQRLAEGAPLSLVAAELAARWGAGIRLLPVTDDALRTRVTVRENAGTSRRPTESEIGFQEYFVRLRHAVPVSAVRFAGADEATPAPGVIAAISEAAAVIIAPSNPIVSIGPVLAVRDVRGAIIECREQTVAVSPIVAGSALRGPASRLMAELGHESSVVGVARLYAPLAAALIVDEADAALSGAVEAEGMRCIVAPTIMHTTADAADLARTALDVADTRTGSHR
jgi:LPPG:FO 2-phospho-L-lactate transferase